MTEKKYFQINSIVKLLKMLELMVEKEEWSLMTLSEQMDVPKATVLRMLLNLKEMGYVEQSVEGKRYYVTTKLFDIGSKALPNIDVFKMARPVMVELAEQCGETVYLTVMSGVDTVLIIKIPSRHTLKVDAFIGDRFRSYQTASGKAMLYTLTSKERAVLFKDHEFESVTSKGISSLESLESDMMVTEKRGYAMVDEERIKGIRSIAVPIFNHQNKAVAGLTAAAPVLRLSEKEIPAFATQVIHAGAEISRRLGAQKQTI